MTANPTSTQPLGPKWSWPMGAGRPFRGMTLRASQRIKPWQRLVWALTAAWLTGCAGLPRPAPPTEAIQTTSGRLQVHVAAIGDQPEHRFSANFELRGNSSTGELDLASPLGTVLARAHWSDIEVWLQTPGQPRQYFPNTSELSLRTLGQEVPLQAFWDWISARPWAGAPSAPRPDGLTPGFSQLGWQIDLSRHAQGWLTLQQTEREPKVTVRIRRDPVAQGSTPTPSP
jgi:outer membrane lipoprotein LolB